jgi:antitoxin MazE
MKARVVTIGRSLIVYLPKALVRRLKQDEIEFELTPEGIIIRPVDVRAGWAESCKAMAEAGDDALIDGPLPSLTSFDEEEWEW